MVLLLFIVISDVFQNCTAETQNLVNFIIYLTKIMISFWVTDFSCAANAFTSGLKTIA